MNDGASVDTTTFKKAKPSPVAPVEAEAAADPVASPDDLHAELAAIERTIFGDDPLRERGSGSKYQRSSHGDRAYHHALTDAIAAQTASVEAEARFQTAALHAEHMREAAAAAKPHVENQEPADGHENS